MRLIDFSSWQALLSTVLGLLLVTLVMVGIRLLLMQTVQRKRERENRQINERLRTLIAAYKTLGGSFTGDLRVDPSHLKERVRDGREPPGSDRRRRIRDAVEAALSDVILLGTADQVKLAVAAANDLVAGRPVETAPLVVALRAHIREVLDLAPVAADIPRQGPARPGGAGGGRGRGEGGGGRGGAAAGGGGGGGGGGRGSGAGGGGGAGLAMGGAGLGAGMATDDGDR